MTAAWEDPGCRATEPQFVPRPGGTAEEDGVQELQICRDRLLLEFSPTVNENVGEEGDDAPLQLHW